MVHIDFEVVMRLETWRDISIKGDGISSINIMPEYKLYRETEIICCWRSSSISFFWRTQSITACV